MLNLVKLGKLLFTRGFVIAAFAEFYGVEKIAERVEDQGEPGAVFEKSRDLGTKPSFDCRFFCGSFLLHHGVETGESELGCNHSIAFLFPSLVVSVVIKEFGVEGSKFRSVIEGNDIDSRKSLKDVPHALIRRVIPG